MPLKDRLGLTKKPLYLVDGSSFLYRGYYAYPDLARSDGFPTNALFIVLRILLRLLREERPTHLGFFLDGPGPTFRHGLYKEYKAQRPRMPEPLAQQIEPLKEAVRLLGLKLVVSDGVEADDLIASLANTFKRERPVVIVASDKDLRQCLDERVFLWDPGGKQDRLTGRDDFLRETGLFPSQWPDFQALTGDASDNIPGVAGVGEKTALKLLHEHPSLEAILAALESLPESLRKKLSAAGEAVYTYRTLARLRTDACPDERLDDYRVRPPDLARLAEFLRSYEFRSLARDLPEALADPGGKPARGARAHAAAQPSLLDLAPAPQAAAEPLTRRRAVAAAGLPDLSGREVGLVAAGDVLFLGLDNEEWEYAGEPQALARALAGAGRVAVPSLQEFLRADDAWRNVPLSIWFDLSLAAYLLDPEARNYSWERLRQALHKDEPEPDAGPPPHPEAQGLAALACLRRLAGRVRAAGLADLMRELETPLVPVLVDMERAGIAIDLAAFSAFLDEVSADIGRLTGEVEALAGGPFNVRSSQQLGRVLFETLGLSPSGKTPGGSLSTGSEALERLADAHPTVERILEFRKLEKLRSTYLEPLPRLVDASGRLHTSFNQLATATGRLSSSGPNLQNIPIRGPEGKRMRACFVAGPGSLLAAADYSQIELRVLAHFSGEPALVEAFRRDEDIHARTAALLFDTDAAGVGPAERRSAKTINFGLIYGMGPQKLARELKTNLSTAKRFIERYFAKLATLKGFYDRVVEEAAERGFVTTLAGRRRLLPDLRSRNQQLQSQARRQAVNTVIQGSAADIIKLAMLKVHSDPVLRGLLARLILQVHDELVLEVPQDAAREAGERLRELMQSVVALDVPLKVDLGVGRTWAEAH